MGKMLRISINQLKTMSDLEFAVAVLQDQYDRMANPNTPAARKLRCAIHTVTRLDIRDKTRPKHSWSIKYYDDEGQRLLAREVSDTELSRIGELVSKGYSCGDLLLQKED